MSWQGQHEVKDEEDNHDQIVLTADKFRVQASQCGQVRVVADKDLMQRICTYSEKDTEVAEALAKVQELGPKLLTKGLEEWNIKQGLILFRKKFTSPTTPTSIKS